MLYLHTVIFAISATHQGLSRYIDSLNDWRDEDCLVFLGPCGVNSVHNFLQGPEVKWAHSSGEENILLYQLMAGQEFGKFLSSACMHTPC